VFNPDDLPPLRDVIAAYGLRAEKSLGQNFLLDQNVTDKIAKLAGDLEDITVFEIGPGPGGLTRSLLKTNAKKIVAIEFDKRAVRALQDLKVHTEDRLEIIQGDALKTNLLELYPAPRAIAANLPYNIATALLIGWLEQIRNGSGTYESMTLMFQKEVGERITAQVGTKAYGRLSVISQWLCDVKKVYDLPPSAFTPPPKVSSCVMKFTPKKLGRDAPSFEAVGKVTAAAFGQRRKMVRSSLKEFADRLEKLGIDPEKRAENLSVQHFINLAKA
jgi:16S rRNA (adenine1518-N6/adenine1519-N6)-dimethyltransferase